MRILLLIMICCSAILRAQNQISKDSITQLDEVILLDALKTKKATGIIPSAVISAKVFQNYSPLDLVSSINQISGIYVLSGALNTNRITIRGIGARTLFGTDKLRLYYNEIPVTNGSGASTIEQYDLENLSQIEVIKGPKGTAYGANLGGAIILTPKHALGKSTNFSNNFTLGSFSLLKNNLSFNHSDKKLQLGLQYGHTKTDGYRENSNFERDGILLNGSYSISSNGKITLLLNHINLIAQIPSSLGATAFAENPQQATFTWRSSQGFETNKATLTGIAYTHTFNEKLKNTSSIFYSYLDKEEARPFGILEEITNGFGFRTRFSGTFLLQNKTTQYSLGMELYKDEYDWDEYRNLYESTNGNGSLKGAQFAKNKEFRHQFNAFATLFFPFSSTFSAQAGLSLNKTSYNFQDHFNLGVNNQSANRGFKTILLPSLNLNYKLSKNNEFYANISRGFSNPNVAETLTPDGVINPDIAQETGTNYEIGTQLYLANKKWQIKAAAYQMIVKNLLVAERINDDQFIGKNAGKTSHRGLEFETNYTFTLAKEIHLTPFVSYTLNHHKFLKFIDEDQNYSGNPLTGVPKHRLSSGLQTNFFQNFYWNTVHQYVGAIPLTDANTMYSEAFHVFNTKIGYRKKLSNTLTIGVDIGINNIFDKVYAQSVLINTKSFGGKEPRYFYPGNERNYYGSLRLGYQL